MKFICENCKAKYQIADEKVAGRTVRMKCRKCGHLIELRASVTETSAAMSLPPYAAESVFSSAPPPASSTPSPLAGKAAAPALRKPVAPPPRASAPKPSGTLGAKPSAAAAPRPVPGVKAPLPPRAQPAAGAGALASAFHRSVANEPRGSSSGEQQLGTIGGGRSGLDMMSPGSTEEWYVGINGVPVGPVRLAEFRAKIASGSVTEESLVWREGFEEWLPLRNFPELMELMRLQRMERLSSPPPPSHLSGIGVKPNSNRSMASAPVDPPTMLLRPPGRSTGLAPPGRNNVIALHARTATAEKIEEKQNTALSDPFATPLVAKVSTIPMAEKSPFDAEPTLATSADMVWKSPSAELGADGEGPFGGRASQTGALGASLLDLPSTAPSFGSPTRDPTAPSVASPKRRAITGGIPIGGWVAIVAALGLGMTAGAVLFGQKAPPLPQVQVGPPAAVSITAPVASIAAAAPTGEQAPTEVPVELAAKPKSGGGSAALKESTRAAAEPATPAVPAVGGVPMLMGPSVNGPSPSGPGNSGQALTSGDIERVVNNGRAALRRACWEPALAAKAGGGPSTARVSVALTIGSDGHVQSASPSGGDAFPTLGPCIASRMRAWGFPSSSGVTQTAVPVTFLQQ